MSTLSATLPRLSSAGHELDLSPEAFGELESSIHLLDDIVALRERMREDGYLFLPGLLSRDEVLDAQAEVAARLEEGGALEPGYPREEMVARTDSNCYFNMELALNNPPLMKVLYDGPMMEFYTRFFGKEVRHFDFTWFRAVTPGNGTRPHMDVVYMGRGSRKLLTAWTPIMDIPIDIGGLMILEKGHRHEKLNANYGEKDVDKFCENKRGGDYKEMGGGGNIKLYGALTDNPVTLRERLGGRWLTADYRAGDLLTFSMNTIHASLDNKSNRIRISSDSRYQPADEPADERWIGENPIAHGPEAKRGMIC